MIKILFICHGNICRSVSAEYIFKELLKRRNLESSFYVDSAATSREEIGNEIYPPMRRTLVSHEIPVLNHHARQVMKQEYDDFDYIIAMDEENMYNLKRLFDQDLKHKVHYLLEYTNSPMEEIEDPWYTRNFEKAYQDILKGCLALLNRLVHE
jgi:protein-tyrosine phosphatase